MHRLPLAVIALLACATIRPHAHTLSAELPRNWHLLDPSRDRMPGTSAERAYRELLAGRPSRQSVVVAIIDVGIDTSHPDLRANLWTNPAEVPGNGIDDDHDGHVDDVHGWNFLGSPDGRNATNDQLEITRLYARCAARPAPPAPLAPGLPPCATIAAEYEAARSTEQRRIGGPPRPSDR
ncbi:MAG: hypothetical protein ABI647_10055 [Gemmatimonadota bacterium]